MRFGREKSAVITTEQTPFEIGEAQTFREGGDVAIVACGILVYNALIAADQLARQDGIECRVVNNHTVKPMDEAAVVDAARACGVRSSPSKSTRSTPAWVRASPRFSRRNYPVPIEFIGVDDRFGQSGDPVELIEFYGMGVDAIVDAVKKVRQRKA